jgi:hypothetical protein
MQLHVVSDRRTGVAFQRSCQVLKRYLQTKNREAKNGVQLETSAPELKFLKYAVCLRMTDDDDAIVVIATTQRSIYQFCQIDSLPIELQQLISQRFNLEFISNELPNTFVVEKAVSLQMKNQIRLETKKTTNVIIHQVIGDGNCLFRSISLGITGTQSQHSLIRSYIVNHMLHSNVQAQLQQSFQTRAGISQIQQQQISYIEHLTQMQDDAVWGTEHEIIAAAHLFDISIVCYSKYNDKQFCLQQFAPHFLSSGTCNNSCNHPVMYLINSSGVHYNLATVSLVNQSEE